MSAREYLEARGWQRWFATVADQEAGISDLWFFGDPNNTMLAADAVRVQRARDAEEERAAWVAFAAGLASHPKIDSTGMVAKEADDLLIAYRARFAVEVEP